MSERATAQDLDEFVSKGVNLYEVLEITAEQLTNEREVRRQYRKKALKYHPDKNPSDEAKEQFDLISRALEILLHPDLKTQYDKKLAEQLLSRQRVEKLSKNLQDLRTNLQQQEQKHRESIVKSKRTKLKVELLRADGVKRRKLKELELNHKLLTKKSQSLHGDYKLKYATKPPLLILKWKLKKDIPSLIETGAISKMMEIFGEILSIKEIPPKLNSRYASCYIEYEDFDSFYRALKHDYSKTSDIWDAYGMRKLSSLLRSVEVVNDKNDNQGDELYFEDYFDQVITRMNKV